MPNHCDNCWRITGPADEIKEFADKWFLYYMDDNAPNPLGVFLPMPVQLRDVRTGSNTINGKKVTRWTHALNPAGEKIPVPLTDEMLKEFEQKFGAADWHSWAMKNWGTKWGAYSCKEPVLPLVSRYNKNEITIDLYFESAWSPPGPALKTLSELHPDWIIEAAYAECGGDYIGRSIARGGSVEDRTERMSAFYTNEPPEGLTEEEEEEFYDNLWDTPPQEKYIGFALDIFTDFPQLGEGG